MVGQCGPEGRLAASFLSSWATIAVSAALYGVVGGGGSLDRTRLWSRPRLPSSALLPAFTGLGTGVVPPKLSSKELAVLPPALPIELSVPAVLEAPAGTTREDEDEEDEEDPCRVGDGSSPGCRVGIGGGSVVRIL